MAIDARRGKQGGGALIIFLIIGWVAAIAGITAAVLVWQDRQELNTAVQENVKSFQTNVDHRMTAWGWDVPQDLDDPHGLVYGSQAHEKVGAKLVDAKKYEDLSRRIGWGTAEELAKSIKSYQEQLGEKEDTHFGTLRQVLEYYQTELSDVREAKEKLAKEYTACNEQLTKLAAAEKEQAKERRKELQQLREEQEQKFNELTAEVGKLRTRWKEAVDAREALEKDLRQVRLDLNKKIAAKEATVEDLKEVIGQLRRRKAAVKELEAQGRVVRTQKNYNMIYLSGGKQEGHQPSDRLIVFTRTPLGDLIKKGEIVVKDVYEYTMMGSLTAESEEHPVVEGDSYVAASVWEDNLRMQKTGAGEAGGVPVGTKVEVTPEEVAAERERLFGGMGDLGLTAEQEKELNRIIAEAVRLRKQGKTDEEIREALKEQTQKFMQSVMKAEPEGGLPELD